MFDRNTIFAFLALLCVILLFNAPVWRKFEEKIGWRKSAPLAQDSTALGKNDKTYQKETSFSDATQTDSVPISISAAKDTTLPSEHFLTIVSDKYIGVLTSRGGKLASWKLRKQEQDSLDLELLPQNTGGALAIGFKGEKTGDSLWFCETVSDTLFLNQDITLVRYFYKSPAGWTISREYRFFKGCYDFDLEIRSQQAHDDEFDLYWDAGIRESEKERMSYMQDPEIIFGMQEGISKEYNLKSGKIEEEKGYAEYVALKSRYFLSVLLLKRISEAPNVTVSAMAADTQYSNSAHNIRYCVNMSMDNGIARYKVVIAPASYELAQSFGHHLGHVIFSGWRWFFRADLWFPYLCHMVLVMLQFFYTWIPNYGVSIIILTLVFRLVTFPLTLKSSRSMARLKNLQPKITELRDKFKNDPMKQQQMMMKLYKEEGVNPFGAGCLPQLLQMPVFIALYIALRKAIELRGAHFALWVRDLSGPEYIPMLQLPVNVPFYGNHVSALALFMAVTMYFSTKQTISDPRQKSMVVLMPIMMVVMMNQMPAGLLLYWAVSNVLGILQNIVIMKKAPVVVNDPKIPSNRADRHKTEKKPLFSLPKLPRRGKGMRWRS